MNPMNTKAIELLENNAEDAAKSKVLWLQRI